MSINNSKLYVSRILDRSNQISLNPNKLVKLSTDEFIIKLFKDYDLKLKIKKQEKQIKKEDERTISGRKMYSYESDDVYLANLTLESIKEDIIK